MVRILCHCIDFPANKRIIVFYENSKLFQNTFDNRPVMPIQVVRVVGERVFLRVIQGDLHQVRVLRLLVQVLFDNTLVRIRVKLTKTYNQRTQVFTIRVEVVAIYI